LAYISFPKTSNSVGFWLQTLKVALLLVLYFVHIPVASDVETQVDVPDSTIQPCDTEWRLTVALIHEYLPSVRHSATVSTQGKQKYFVVGGPRFGSWKVQDIYHFYKALRPALGSTHPLIKWVTGILSGSKEARA
jgi:hypothetical protein